jgi:hypothetical protein
MTTSIPALHLDNIAEDAFEISHLVYPLNEPSILIPAHVLGKHLVIEVLLLPCAIAEHE